MADRAGKLFIAEQPGQFRPDGAVDHAAPRMLTEEGVMPQIEMQPIQRDQALIRTILGRMSNCALTIFGRVEG